MTYTTDAQVTAHLPSTLPEEWDAVGERATYIADASELVEGMVGGGFAVGTYDGATQKFPDVGDDPPTPMIIQIATGYVAAGLILDDMKAQLGGKKTGKEQHDIAEGYLRNIRSGEIEVRDEDGTAYHRDGIATNVESTTPVFGVGRYDADGNLVSSEEGSTDDFVAG